VRQGDGVAEKPAEIRLKPPFRAVTHKDRIALPARRDRRWLRAYSCCPPQRKRTQPQFYSTRPQQDAKTSGQGDDGAPPGRRLCEDRLANGWRRSMPRRLADGGSPRLQHSPPRQGSDFIY
jgi:hypothetical protein